MTSYKSITYFLDTLLIFTCAHKKNLIVSRLQIVFVPCSMISHLGFAAQYETERIGNKEDIAFITLARCHVTSDNFAKEMEKLKPQEQQDVAAWLLLNLRSHALRLSQRLIAFSVGLGVSPPPHGILKLSFSAGLCVVNSFFNLTLELDFFGPKWHSLRSYPFQGPKKSRFLVPTPSNAPRNGSCPPQNHYVPRHINNRYTNSYFSVIHLSTY